MKTIFLSIFIILVQFGSGQTKSETKNWIKFKFESGGLTGIQKYDIYFIGEYLKIRNETSLAGSLYVGEYRVKIKCISNFYFKDYEKSLHLIIKTLPNCKIQYTDLSGVSDKNYVELIFDKSFANNDMKNRFTKAMNNLFKYYGGSVVKEVY